MVTTPSPVCRNHHGPWAHMGSAITNTQQGVRNSSRSHSPTHAGPQPLLHTCCSQQDMDRSDFLPKSHCYISCCTRSGKSAAITGTGRQETWALGRCLQVFCLSRWREGSCWHLVGGGKNGEPNALCPGSTLSSRNTCNLEFSGNYSKKAERNK